MQAAVLALILGWLAWHLALPVDFIRSDLGRHIKNGELILQGNWDVLYRNFYSYTCPQYPFVNHHWLFGVFCFVLWHYFGFTGLSFVYLGLQLAAFYVFFRCGQRYVSFPMACGLGLLSFPLVAFRSEPRPEGISYLLCGIFWWMLDSFRHKSLSQRDLVLGLCLLQVLWVNTHVFFIAGPVLAALFWLQAAGDGQKQEAKVLQKFWVLLLALCLINPSGICGLLVPFNISAVYTYWILETQPLSYLLNSMFRPWESFALYILIMGGLLYAALFYLLRREGYKKYILTGVLTVALSLAVLKAIRMIGLLGFFWLPLSMFLGASWLKTRSREAMKFFEVAVVAAGILVSALVNFDWKKIPSLGLVPGSNQAAEFFKQEKISGPIFNNYDIGSYLIFHLGPSQKVFVDNRMEAYPGDFFAKTYIPMQLNNGAWQRMDGRYHFNAIFFSLDVTPWGSAFLKERCADPAWAIVYDSDKAIILLKRNAQNDPVIRHNEIKTIYVQA